MANDTTYDSRYLKGVDLFNRQDYFEAHEVWEELWQDCASADRRFYQSLIQAAVALYHWSRGNYAGASRLLQSGRRYMQGYGDCYLGLDVNDFWAAVASRIESGSPPPIITLRGAP